MNSCNLDPKQTEVCRVEKAKLDCRCRFVSDTPDGVGVGKIKELSSEEVELVAPHIKGNPGTVYSACSGVCLTGQSAYFRSGEQLVAIEWVRQESRPSLGEPECNVYRYLIGLNDSGECVGYEVTKRQSSASTGQVADHWTTFDEVTRRHFSSEYL